MLILFVLTDKSNKVLSLNKNVSRVHCNNLFCSNDFTRLFDGQIPMQMWYGAHGKKKK